MKDKIETFLFICGFIIALCVLVNLFHLIWYIADPEGFWSFTFFLELLRIGGFVIMFTIIALFLIIYVFSSLIASFRNGFNKKEFLKGIGLLTLLMIIPFINYMFSNAPFLYITGTMADKYSHLKTTERYLYRGETLKACEYAEKAYEKELNKGKIASFFFLTNWYSSTDFDRSKQLTSRYAAIIAYGLCQKESSGSLEGAEGLFERALRISDSELLQEEKASFLSFPLMALAEINLQRGDYLKAEEYFEQLEAFHAGIGSQEIEYRIQGRLFFADRAVRTGDLKKAANIYLKNVQLYEENSEDEDSPFYLGLLLMASLTETQFQNYHQAKELILKAASIAEENEDNLLYPNYLITKANFIYEAAINDLDASQLIERSWFERLGDIFKAEESLREQLLKEAEALYSRAVVESADKSGRESYLYVSSLRQLGDFYYKTGKFKKAEESFKKAQLILDPVKDENPDIYNDIVLSGLRTNKEIDFSLIAKVEDQIFRRISANFLFLTEEEKENYIAKTEKQLALVNSIYINDDSPRANKLIYNNILATKQLALNSSKHIRQFINQAPIDLNRAYTEILKEKEKLQNITNQEKHRVLSRDLADKERNLNLQIAKQMTFAPFAPREVEWEGIRNSLGQKEVAIEMFGLPVWDDQAQKEDNRYFALVLKRDSDHPVLLPLFREKELEKLLNKSGSTSESINAIYESGRDELLEMLWKPLLSKVHEADAVYLSVNGILQNISFPALLLDQPGELHLLGSTRDISKVKASQPVKKKHLALFGDANFNSSENSGETRSFRTVENQVKQGLEAGLFPALEYTRQEIDTIEKIFRPVAGSLLKLTGDDASEKSFRNLDNGYNIVHLATHGFYFKSNAAVLTRGLDLIEENYAADNPMYRSGLLLSGSEDLNNPRNNDGILTAVEISRMDLSAVDLMILSACETARGDISGSEGVFGLQRALKLAGVKDQIVSLWQVPDKQTAELFEIFYRQFSLGNTVHSSLNKAQTQMAQKYPPFYWAGFILLE
ncbi:CHAT domain-containing protein [Salegentibacter maritimus]|uniref:CHAT domain-containing protein n=1 Tax=Salegentibacter maritimus TaxID=2794347 RepID=UPI0018E4974E|nr:CHAT domain-containing protein [Salegentibacter maritimus]MBI6115971.1 CHAT domain-containing protein [Salegentibacter maritimus]